MTSTLYAKTAGGEDALASDADDCDTNNCFFCTSPETD
jgi:hypothetical protein